MERKREKKEENKLTPGWARILAAGFLLLGVFLGFFNAPRYVDKFGFPFRLGLDLAGGTHLVYEADVSGAPSREREGLMEALRDTIERRVNLFGVEEPVVQVESSGASWRLIVELADIKDVGAAVRTIGETPFLEFKEEKDEAEVKKILDEAGEGGVVDPNLVFRLTPLSGKHIKGAEVLFDPTTNEAFVSLELTDEGGEIFAELTRRNIGRPLAIYLDGELVSSPIVQDEITGGRAQITGRFTPQEAKELAGRLNAGALPVPIKLISQETIGASLGREAFAKGVMAGIYGIAAVAIFMILWYRLPGLISVLALGFYIFLVLAIFKLIPVTLTVSGIAGFILSIGMAVDANILIFERTKEELGRGKALEEAVREGFGRAWTSIRDSNVSSLITSTILYWIGTSVVQGFALTLGIGVLISMISAIWVTRIFLIALMSKRLEAARFMFLSGLAK